MPVLTEHRLRIGDRVVTLLEGPAGWGEYSPLPGYPSDPSACRRAAEEAAIYGFPPAHRQLVAVNTLVDGPNFNAAALLGFAAVKVKVRSPADIDVVVAVRDAIGPGVPLRIDANGAWDVETAIDMITRLSRYDLELVEQPVASLDDLARVRRAVNVPIAADECVRTVDDARRLRALGSADVIVLKQQPLGGVRAALAIAEVARVPALVSSMMETSVGIAAGLALAAALPDLPFACGLATASSLAGDVVVDPPRPVDGMMPVQSSRARPRAARSLPGRHQVSDLGGPFEVARVPGARDHLDARVPDRDGHLARDLHVLGVELADDQEHRHGQLAEAVPVRRLRALPEHAQLRGETLDGVGAPALVETGSIWRQRGEHGLGEPALEERVDAIAFDRLRECLVGVSARRPLGRIGDARRRAHQHEPPHHLGPVERELQAQPPAHRVAHVRRLELPEGMRGFDERRRVRHVQEDVERDAANVIRRRLREDSFPRAQPSA